MKLIIIVTKFSKFLYVIGMANSTTMLLEVPMGFNYILHQQDSEVSVGYHYPYAQSVQDVAKLNVFD